MGNTGGRYIINGWEMAQESQNPYIMEKAFVCGRYQNHHKMTNPNFAVIEKNNFIYYLIINKYTSNEIINQSASPLSYKLYFH